MLSDPSGISPHTLQFADVCALPTGLLVTIKSTKTRSSLSCPFQIILPALPSSLCCPVQGWKNYKTSSHPDPSGLALVLPSGKPLTPRLLTNALRSVCAPVIPGTQKITLHGLRRGVAQACQDAGVSMSGLILAGTWRGPTVQCYLSRIEVNDDPSALASLLGER